MKKTKNYAMPYPEQDDYFNVEDFQDMMVSVDDLMKKLSDSGAQISSDAEHLYNQTKAQMDNIQKRMNAFTALRDGSTTGDAELKDIRVAYDGKEYGNAGEAVREQASDIHKALFGAGASIWSKVKAESTKYVAETKGICILNECFTAAGVVTKISRGTFAENESTLNLDRECSAYIVEFEKNPGTVYMPSAETIKIVSTTKIIFEANGNARCWIPVEKGQYLAVDSTATAYTSESNHVPYMLYDQANKTLECRGFGSTGSIEPVDPYSLALEYKLEYDMDDTGLVKQIDANREAAASLKEDLGDFNGLGSFNNITKTLEFGYVNELGQYAKTNAKQNMFMPLVHCVPGYKFIFTNPLDIDAWLSIHLYSTELLYKGRVSEVLCEKEKTVSYTVEEECFIRASVNKRYATASTNEELAEVQNNFYVCNVGWLPIPVEKYNDSLKIDINTLAYYRRLVERKTGDFTFCYQTDTHYSQSGTYKTLDNLKNLVNIDHSIKPNFCSNLGDVTHGYLNRAVGMDDYMKAMSVYKAIKMFLPVQGNHENNTLYTFQHTQNRNIKEIIQKNWFFDSVFVPFCIKNNGVIDKNKLYYSVDFDKVKVIVLDTNDLPETEVNSNGQLIFASGYQAGIRQEQLDWLIDTLKMPNPKPVVILSHHSLSAGASEDANTVYNANAVRGILEAYDISGTFTLEQNPYGGEYFKISVNCDFTGAKEYKGANVIGCFAGHTHADAMYTINNIHYVVSDSSVPDTSENKEARKSDATSDVIETVKIDTSKKEVNIIRFGYGIAVKDRSFTY